MHVDIQGQRYAIRSELDPKYVNDLAAYVDQRMERVGRELASTDGVRLAVLAALNIADELFRARVGLQWRGVAACCRALPTSSASLTRRSRRRRMQPRAARCRPPHRNEIGSASV
jgi:cell division protein ZapA (FtsZ GTPase activity inhibitor)